MECSFWHFVIVLTAVVIGIIILYAIRYYRESGKILGIIRFLSFFALITVGMPHVDPVGDEQPMSLPPDIMFKAAISIESSIESMTGIDISPINDIDLFLSDDYWPVPLNNSSVMNLSA